MKRGLVIAAVLMLLLGGCQGDREADGSAYGDEMAKAQEITVVSAATSEVLETLTSKEEVEHFILSLDLAQWEGKTLPAHATELGFFKLAQEETIPYGQTHTDGSLHEIATITLYDGSYIGVEIGGLTMPFGVSEETAAYLRGYFA